VNTHDELEPEDHGQEECGGDDPGEDAVSYDSGRCQGTAVRCHGQTTVTVHRDQGEGPEQHETADELEYIIVYWFEW